MAQPLQVLIVEDSENDAELLLRQLRKAGFEPEHQRVQDAAAMRRALDDRSWDVVLSDYSMPRFTGLEALELMRETGQDLPFILISGTVGEDVAVAAMRAGAHDYLMKGHLRLLGQAIEREMEAAQTRRERARGIAKIDHLNRVLRAIRDINQLIVREHDPAALIQRACERLIATRGYRGAWIAIGNGRPAPTLQAEAGWGDRFAPLAAELRAGRWPACRRAALAAGGEPALIDPAATCHDCPLRGHHDDELSLVSALRHGEDELGLLAVAVPRELPIDTEERGLLAEVAGDIGFALHDIDLERRRSETEAALRDSERMLNDTGQMARIGGWEHDLQSKRLIWTRALYDIIGIPRDRELPGLDAHLDAYPERDRRILAEAHQRAVAAGEPFDLELQVRTAGGELRWCRVQGTPEFAGGAFARVRGTFQDITDRKHMEAQLAQADRLSSMGMLAAGVAHEINNPLSYVLYNLESLVEDLPDLLDATRRYQARVEDSLGAERAEALLGDAAEQMNPAMLGDIRDRFADALDGAQRIKSIARGLGTFSRVERDKLVPVKLKHVIEVAINMAYNEIKYRARLVKDYAATSPVLASEGRLAQVFLNLLINATHAIEEGRVEANEIRLRTWEADGAVWASVADSGQGIDPQHMQHLFQPFFTTKEAGVGSGLGLAISKNIIEGYGGAITVDSQPGRGTCFTIRLPLRDAAAEPAPQPDAPDAPAVQGRILIVDDEAGIRHAMLRMLRGHRVVQAASGAEARRILEGDAAFDLILCDMMMPEVSGMDLHRWLREAHPDLAHRLIFITGGAFTPKARDYLNQVDNLRLEKPFDVTNFRKIVAEIIKPGDA